jgi:hypothetical protein
MHVRHFAAHLHAGTAADTFAACDFPAVIQSERFTSSSTMSTACGEQPCTRTISRVSASASSAFISGVRPSNSLMGTNGVGASAVSARSLPRCRRARSCCHAARKSPTA